MTEPQQSPESPRARSRIGELWHTLRARWWSRWLFDLALVALVVAAIWAWQTRHLVGRGEPAPPLDLVTLDGTRFSLHELRGQEKVVVAFWSPWCGVCALETGPLGELYEDARTSDRFSVVAVMLSWEDRAEVERFVAEHDVRLPVLLGDERVRREWAVESYPTIYIVDREGRIEHGVVGYTTEAGLRVRLW